MIRDEIGKRMKDYEQVAKGKLVRRMPVIIRIDGKAHHTFTRNFKKPFDESYMRCMQETMKYLCENIQGCVLGYTQSDEITLVLVDYKKLDSSAWFDNEIQKICSVSASMATMAFNKYFYGLVLFMEENKLKYNEMIDIYKNAILKGSTFDSRCFNVPKEEVTNCVYWRQLDATRNSIQMVGQANFSHKELQNKSCNDIQDMLFTQKGINWNDLPTTQRRGCCCIKVDCEKDLGDGVVVQTKQWVIDNDIPQFKGDGREYIEKLINVSEE